MTRKRALDYLDSLNYKNSGLFKAEKYVFVLWLEIAAPFLCSLTEQRKKAAAARPGSGPADGKEEERRS